MDNSFKMNLNTLTDRERQIIHLISEGKQNKEIQHLLNIAQRTVENHLTNIYAKLGVSSRTEAARLLWLHISTVSRDD